jgi:recombination protein RecA
MAKVKADEKELLSESQAWSHITSMFGEGALFHPDEIEGGETFTTRSPMLDRALGVGGWALGRIYQVAGKPSSGKTFLGLLAMAEWQSKDPENMCVFIDAEYTYDPSWAAQLGVDNDRVLLVKTNAGEKIFTGLVGTPKKNKTTGKVTQIDGLLDMAKKGQWISHKVNGKTIKLNLGKLGVIVLDSVAVMQAPQELESAVGKINMAPLPRFLTQELKKLTPAVAEANVCFIAINHVKEKIGEMFGNPETTPGGAAWKHACSVMLMVAQKSGADNQLVDANEEKYGHKILVKVEKNKMAKPFKRAEFFIDFTSGIAAPAEELLDLGCLYNLIERPNNRTYIINGESLTSRSLAIDYIAENRSVVEEMIRGSYLSGESVSVIGEGEPEAFNPFEQEELLELNVDVIVEEEE